MVRAIIKKEAAGDRQPLVAATYHKKWETFSKPCLIATVDGSFYVVKGSQVGRPLFTEYVCCRAGNLIGAPTLDLKFFDVATLRSIEPKMSHFGSGLALGTREVPNVSERIDGIQYFEVGDNRQRFASLALLFAWFHADDCQFLYNTVPPELVYSHDHGHFFPGSTGWQVANLKSCPGPSKHNKFASCAFKDADFAQVRLLIGKVTKEDLTDIVAAPPTEWGVSAEERAAVADFLHGRLPQVQNLY